MASPCKYPLPFNIGCKVQVPMGAYSGTTVTAIIFTAGGHKEQSLSPSPTPSNLLPPTFSPCSHAGGECKLSTCRNGVLASSYCLFVSLYTIAGSFQAVA